MAYRLEPNPLTQEPELVIDGWEDGIATSPEAGVNIRNCNIESVPATVRPNWRSNLSSIAQFSYTFTANAATDTLTLSGAGSTIINMNLQAVQLTTTGTLPAGLSLATTYYMIITGGLGAGTYQLATTLPNANSATAINITDAGSGVHTISNAAIPMGTINYMLNVPVTASGITTFYQFAYDNAGKVWFYDSSQQWIFVDGNSQSNNSGNGLSYFVSSGGTTYLFAIRNANIDVLNVSTFLSAYSPTWVTGYFALNTPSGFTGSHLALLAQDNKIYLCDSHYIDSISEKVGQNFDPNSSATFTNSSKALTLPSFSSAQCIETLATNILIGDKNSNFIYPWDKQSTNFTNPLRVAENDIWRLLNIDNTVYALCGTKGHVYSTAGYSFNRVTKISEYLSGGSVVWGGIEKISGCLVIGLTAVTTAAAGAYKLYTTVGTFAGSIIGSLISDETPSIGATNPTAILAGINSTDNSPNEFYFMGYAGGIDLLDNTNKYSNYESYVESDIVPIGTYAQQKTFNTLEYKLDFAPSAGSIQVFLRSNLNGNYTQLISDSGSDSCIGIVSQQFKAGVLQNAQWIQIKVAMKNGTGFDCPRLREIRIR